MNPLAESSPAITATRDGRFPGRPGFPGVWEEVLRTSAAWQDLDCGKYLSAWCGYAPDHLVEKFTGVDHVGIYMGDYTSDEEVFDWHAYLNGLRASGAVTSVEMGPSYISPRQYGTPGWWNSVSLSDGRVIEMFACRRFGPWADRRADEKGRLMSHVAIGVRTGADVRHLLDVLDREVGHLENIAYTEADEVGHTYGHLRNNDSGTVLEIVYEEPRDGTGHTDDRH
ncbi:hypothetical protein SUDANB6_01326 [Streptomyces sp. enrichment culture]|uniref:hypothetical protein n=1 Tax=Streptomyces sp. enrichment culture TaxID=1795815 RepID=UPI003F579B15